MLTVSLLTAETNAEGTVYTYTAHGSVTTAGDGIWGAEAGRTFDVTGITVIENTLHDYTLVDVEHNTTWEIYTDSALPKAVSAALQLDVDYTEQGMQSDGLASLEC